MRLTSKMLTAWPLAEKFANIDLKLGGVHNTAVTLPILASNTEEFCLLEASSSVHT